MTRRGLFLPPFDVLADPALVAELAAEAEEAGWDGVFVWDHLIYADPVREIADPWICCAAIAAATSRIQLGPMVTPLSRRRPQVLARQAASLDRLSGGRLVLGFGLGDDGRVGELSRFGEETDAKARAAMLDEGLGVLRGLLSGEPVDHDGPHAPARGVTFAPAGTRPGGIPFWIGGRWPNKPPLRRAARHQGAFVIAVETPDDLAGARAVLADVRAAAGAGMDGFDLVVQLGPGEDPAPWADAGATWVLTQVGPYHLDLAEVRRVVRAGP
ncbi:LLM class flavin-dependent oxidoreductase [Microlunatus capsulatus]|uniref:Alkanesulfonate monooxygenase SsuD/methylene tetrahydromethanopterin reductase-like flavin-dependent oxidoreductase (Luciferase family) n=1 Tax=Microlunatus capsulatus TaxID=99117 RepID=A0ABS4Z2I4_9ACTN|nr:LLM class flavin-dependent oxidoreductase [Microlunatus capsulatus]MBP2415261.1 alkanesulfonate monooxygenase SsuD/methylene tetrahydromethanopterin reductase-like flavin-dependent oxidoreductase (luciferase family) [Microlunatus capsulatus]